MKRLLVLALLAFSAVFMAANVATAAHVVPVEVAGNPPCPAGLTELKIEPVVSGVYTDGDLTINLTVNNTADGQTFDWTSNIGVDVVIAKGGPNGNVYTYVPESLGDTGLHAPENASGDYAGLSHISFCYDLPVLVPLEADVTATASFDRTITWTLDKSVDDDSHAGVPGQSFVSNWTVVADKTVVDGVRTLSGLLTITNPNEIPVDVAVAGSLSTGDLLTISCPATTIAAFGQLVCTIEATLPDDDSGTADFTITSLTPGVNGVLATTNFSVDVNLTGDVTTTLTDDRYPLNELLADDFSITYPETFTCPTDESLYVNRTYTETFPNTANLVGDTTNLTDSASVVLVCTIPFEGCTPGFWKQTQHFDQWVGYTQNQTFFSVFGVNITVKVGKTSIANPTLLQALNAEGGDVNALARHAVAALLNAASDVDYPYTTAQVIAMVQAALAPGGDIEGTKNLLAAANELGCPLS